MGVRFAAVALDTIVITIPIVAAAIAFVAGPKRPAVCNYTSFDGTVASEACEVPTDNGLIAIGALLLVAVLFGFWYLAILQGNAGYTWGKKAMNLRVVDARTIKPLGPWRSLKREGSRIVFAALPILGPLLDHLRPLWNDDAQTWHDRVAGSAVIPLNKVRKS